MTNSYWHYVISALSSNIIILQNRTCYAVALIPVLLIHPPSKIKNIMSKLIEELKVKLIEILNLADITPEDFDENDQLVGGELGIDSIDVLEMVVMVEKDYGIVINSQEVGEKVFSSLTNLADFIEKNSTETPS